MKNGRIINLAAPSLPHDAVNKDYLDQKFDHLQVEAKLVNNNNNNNCLVFGPDGGVDFKQRRIINLMEPQHPSDVVTQGYVWDKTLFFRSLLDAYDAKKRRIVNVANPVSDQDAVTLKYLRDEMVKLKTTLIAELSVSLNKAATATVTNNSSSNNDAAIG